MANVKTVQPTQDQIARYRTSVDEELHDRRGAQLTTKTKFNVPTLQQNVLAQLNHGGWILKGGAALRRHFGAHNHDDWFVMKPRVMRVTSVTQVGEQIVIDFNTDDSAETITVPFRVKSCNTLRIELEEEYMKNGRKPKGEDDGQMKQFTAFRNALTLEHNLRSARARGHKC